MHKIKEVIGMEIKVIYKNVIRHKSSYLFMFPFLSIFFLFTVFAVITAIYYSFTQFNILESPVFVGFNNYEFLFLYDDIFVIAIRNTIIFASITGPVSYLACLMLAWFVNELSSKMRALLTLLFYAPTLANIFFVWQLIFGGDSNSLVNGWLLRMGIILEPIQWLTNEKYMVPIVLFVVLWASLGASFLAFIAGFQMVDISLYEAGAVDGIKNRWQELWFITLPYIRPQMMFGAVMSITGSFNMGAIITGLVGYPSTNYAAHTLMNHLEDYGGIRYEMGYACAIATILFLIMLGANKGVHKLLMKVGE